MNDQLKFQPSTQAHFMQQSQVDLGNGIQLHVEMGGNPEHPCILLIMGLGAQMILWPDAFCKQLIDQGFCVVRFDNRDIGLSTKIQNPISSSKHLPRMMLRYVLGLKNTGAPYLLEDMADDVALLIDKLGLNACNVIGASMGGMIAQILAAKYPQKVTKLAVLFSSNNRAFLPPPGLAQLKKMFYRQARDEDAIIQQTVELYQLIGSPQYTQFSEVKQLAQRSYRRSYAPMGVLQQLLAILCTGSLRQWDRKIKQSTLVVHGSCDRLLPPKHGRSIAKEIQGAKFEFIEGMGHDIPPYFIPQLCGLFASHFKS